MLDMTYRETVDYLKAFINYENIIPGDYLQAFTLDRIKRLLALLGEPHKNLVAVHIAGTKGKGSTAAMAASILRLAGYKTGLYTSPHLTSLRERISLNGGAISEEALCAIVSETRPCIEKMRSDGISFFEILTALAFLYFKREGADVVIMETGLGGRLDATNALERSVAVITPISYEHTRVLGHRLKDIAREKAGIIKDGSACVCAPQEEEALDVIEGVCAKARSRLCLAGRDILAESGPFDGAGQSFSVWGRFSEYPLLETHLLGEHQITNAACAIGAVECLRTEGVFVGSEAVRAGLLKAEWPGRMEVIGNDPLLVADGAQNAASAQALMSGVRRHFNFKRLILVLGTLADKDMEGLCGILAEAADRIILTRPGNPRAAAPEKLAEYIKDKEARILPDPGDALSAAYREAGKYDLILVTGSLYLVGQIRKKTVIARSPGMDVCGEAISAE